MLIYSLVIMGVATFLIGLLPTYATIGVWAPVLLVLLRCAQGIGVGGEWGGAVLMAVEHSPPGRRGLSGSWPQMGVPAGLLLSTVVFGVVSTALGEEAIPRVGLARAVSVERRAHRRRPVHPSADSRVAGVRAGWSKRLREARPLVAAVRDYRRNLLLAMGMRVAENGLFYVYTVFVLSYGPAALGVSRATMLWGVTLAALGGTGRDSVFRRACRTASAAGRCICSAPCSRSPTRCRSSGCSTRDRPPSSGWRSCWAWRSAQRDVRPQAAYFSELFGARVRYSGASLSYQLASVVAGGLAPFIATALLANWGTHAVAAYMMLLASITVAATYAAPETHRGGLAD